PVNNSPRSGVTPRPLSSLLDANPHFLIARPYYCPMKTNLALFALFLSLAAFAGESPATFKVGGISFTRPEKWEWVPTTSAMRAAQLKVNDADGKGSAEVVFFQFGAGQGGDAKANVERWLAQFEEPREKLNSKTETVTVGKAKVTYVTAEGTYRSGMPGGPA